MTPRSFGIDFDPIRDNEECYDLRMGESLLNNSSDANTYQDQINKTHAMRAEIEDYRQKLLQSDQVLEFYKKVLDEEIKKKNEFKQQLNHLRLIQEYGYDDDERSIGEMKLKLDDMKMLLQEKAIALEAQKHINKQLTLQLQQKAEQEDGI
jgi:hypothetical protein